MKNRTFRKALSALLTLALLLAFAPTAVIPVSALDESDWEYAVDGSAAVITGYKGADTDVVVPGALGGYTVTGIAANAFSGRDDLLYVFLPDSLETIGNSAFSDCTNLYSVGFGSGLKSIGDYAFRRCFSLAIAINSFPDSLETIGNSAFNSCISLTAVSFPASLKTLGYSAFEDSGIETATFSGAGPEKIGNFAFSLCDNLESVTFGSGLKSIGNNAFRGCRSLEINSFPDSLESIGSGAFSGCYSITSVSFPASLKTLGNNAFESCTALATVNLPFTGTEWTAAGGWTYYGVTETNNPELYNAALTFVQPVFEYTNNGGVTITGCTNIDRFPDLVIPAQIGGSDVTDIADDAFKGKTSLKSVTLPDSVSVIGHGAFSDCTSLESVEIPDSSRLHTIYNVAFQNCSALRSISLPDGLSTLGQSAFENCSSLASVTFGSRCRVDGIGFMTFKGCSSLTSIVLPDAVRIIEDSAFDNCSSLASVTFCNRLEMIGYMAFCDCDALESVVFPSSLKTLSQNAFFGCESLATVTFGGSPESINGNAFFGCESLATVNLPFTRSEWNTAGGWSKYGVDASNNAELYNAALTFVKPAPAFTYEVDYRGATVTGCTNIDDIEDLVIPAELGGEPVLNIGEDAFRNCDGVKTVILPDSLEIIDYNAFKDCSALATVDFGSGVGDIRGSAFENCGSLTSVTFPDSLDGIGIGAFKNCTSLATVTFGSGLEDIDCNAFENCGVTSLVFPDSLELIDEYAFSDCGSLTYVDFGDGVKEIGQGAFEGCILLGTVVLPASLGELYEEAFAGCSSLRTVVFSGEGPEEIGSEAFYGCGNLESVTFGSGLKTIGEYAFDDCVKLATVTFPDSLETIDERAFYGCAALTSVTFGSGLKTIGEDAFYECAALATVNFAGTRRQWNAIDVSNAGLPSEVTVICKGDFAADTAIAISGGETYGSTLTAGVTDLPADVEDAVISWYNDDGDLLGTGETYVITVADVGHAVKAVLSSENAVASVSSDFTAVVGKARITNYTLPTAASIKYPQTLAEAVLTGGDTGTVEGVWAWSTPGVQPTSAQSGSSFELTFTPTGEYAALYESITAHLAVTIEPADFEPQTMEDTRSGLSVTGEFAQNVTLTLTDITYSQSAYIAMLRASSKDASGLPVLVLFKTFDFGVDADAYTGTLTVSSYVGEKYAGNTYSVWFFVDGAPVRYEGAVDADGVLVIAGVEL